MPSANKDLLNCIIEEIFNANRTGLIPRLYAPECEGYSPDGPFLGPEGFGRVLEKYRVAFPDFRLHVNCMIAESDRIVVHYTFEGTHTGPLAGMAPTGMRMHIPGIMISRVENNRVIEQSFVWDNLGPRRQVWLASVAERMMAAADQKLPAVA
jgi:predicted ester cyclase